MGVIYQAHDPVIDRKVAIKLIRADLLSGEDHADYLARFQQEAQAAGRCMHPNIVALYDCAVHQGNPFLAMEYVEGASLAQVLAQSGRLSLSQAVAVIDQVLSALDYAHGLGVVHRDVKPANIMLMADGRVKMTDFGIARLDSSELTQRDSVLGTPSYMSPEQCRGEVVDARSDLFSAGVVLYEALSGERPFAGRNFTEVAVRLIHEPPPDIRSKWADIPAGLADVIDRALAKQPTDRFTSAEAMAGALRQSMGAAPHMDQTIVAPHIPKPAGSFAPATLDTLARRLAQHVGPIAQHLVRTAARQATTLDQLCETLAAEIEQPEERAQFRREVLTTQTDVAGQTTVSIPPAQVQNAERELTQYLGPIARILVRRALSSAHSVEEFRQILASHIEHDADRNAFLARWRS
jgi:serine/threonine-protein kinase